MGSVSARHSAASGEWYTPAPIVEACRAALGGVIDLDPATCGASQARVQARTYGTIEKPATLGMWRAARTVFLNPPTPPRLWWEALSSWYMDRAGLRAIYVAYSLEQLPQSTRWNGASMLDHRVLFPSKRISYERLEGGALVKGGSPPHAGALVILGQFDASPLLAALGGRVLGGRS